MNDSESCRNCAGQQTDGRATCEPSQETQRDPGNAENTLLDMLAQFAGAM